MTWNVITQQECKSWNIRSRSSMQQVILWNLSFILEREGERGGREVAWKLREGERDGATSQWLKAAYDVLETFWYFLKIYFVSRFHFLSPQLVFFFNDEREISIWQRITRNFSKQKQASISSCLVEIREIILTFLVSLFFNRTSKTDWSIKRWKQIITLVLRELNNQRLFAFPHMLVSNQKSTTRTNSHLHN